MRNKKKLKQAILNVHVAVVILVKLRKIIKK